MIIAADDAHFAAIGKAEPVGPLTVIAGGVETPETVTMLRGLAQEIRQHFNPAAWMIVEESVVVGLCSLVKMPNNDGAIEIGYGVAESHRNRGTATRAIHEVLAWARNDPRVSAVHAETSVGNPASHIVLERNAFIRTGTRVDAEDGMLIRWAVDTTS